MVGLMTAKSHAGPGLTRVGTFEAVITVRRCPGQNVGGVAQAEMGGDFYLQQRGA